MDISTKELRTHAKQTLDAVERGEPVTITYRGKPTARLVRISADEAAGRTNLQDCELFGIWADRDDLDDAQAFVRRLRRGRGS